MGLKRSIADVAEALTGTRISEPENAGLVFGEEHLKRFFSHFKVDCVFDVGANEGQYAEMLRRRVGFRGPVISFEPIPEVASRLRVKASRTEQWFVEEIALDSAEGMRAFNVMTSNQFSSLLSPLRSDLASLAEANAIERQITLMTSTLLIQFNKYKAKLGFKRPFLKMDTQGNDLAIAQGAGELLKAFVGLQSELSVCKLYDGAADFLTALHYYQSKGFELSAFIPNNAAHFPALIEVDCVLYQSRLDTKSIT